MRETLLEKFSNRVLIGDGCWPWVGSIAKTGYGQLSVRTPTGVHTHTAHRLAYELLVGPIPDGITLDHLCYTRHCVRPSHLDPVTTTENTARGTALRDLRAASRALESTPSGPGHGTRSKYTSGCRCELCTAANRHYHRQRRRGFLSDPDLTVPHVETTLAKCCGGFGEHFDWCLIGQELRNLEEALMRRGVVRDRNPAHPALEAYDEWVAAIRRQLASSGGGA